MKRGGGRPKEAAPREKGGSAGESAGKTGGEEKLSRRISPEGALYIVSTPIGNLADITLRALEILRSVDIIAAEDTRHTRKLLSKYDIHKPLVSYHENNARQRGAELLEKIESGLSIAVVTDAGTPGISDPGALLVESAIEHGIEPVPIPGPAALISALVISGLPPHPFCFLGFPPARGTERKRFFRTHAAVPMTLILYESPKRLGKTLADVLEIWGDRRIAVARELTKIHEEVFRGNVSEAAAHFGSEARGELCLVIEGVGGFAAPVHDEGGVCRTNLIESSPPRSGSELADLLPVPSGTELFGAKLEMPAPEPGSWEEELRRLLENGIPSKTAASEIASKFDIPRRTAYQAALKIRESNDRKEEIDE